MCVFGGRKLSTNGTELRLLVQSLRVTQRAFTHCGRTIDRVLNLGGVDRGSALCSPVPMFPGTDVPGTYVPRYLCSPIYCKCVECRVCEGAHVCVRVWESVCGEGLAYVQVCVRACVRACRCSCVRALVRERVYMCAWPCVCTWVRECVRMRVLTRMHACEGAYVRVCVCASVCMSVCARARGFCADARAGGRTYWRACGRAYLCACWLARVYARVWECACVCVCERVRLWASVGVLAYVRVCVRPCGCACGRAYIQTVPASDHEDKLTTRAKITIIIKNCNDKKVSLGGLLLHWETKVRGT